MSEIKIGDRVEFSGRGNTITGTVTDVKYSRPGSRNALVKAYGLPTPTQRKLVVMPDDGAGAGVWTVPERMCKKLGPAGDANKAIKRADEIITSIQRQRSERSFQGRQKATDSGLYDLNKGDAIEVQFRGGDWRRMKFSHISASGQVGFYRDEIERRPDFLGLGQVSGMGNRRQVRFSPPQFVRKAQV